MENKTGKYFKYAIGEIVLVVIGILIALSINNWNEIRLLKKEELKILKSLHNEMKDNLVLFNNAYAQHKRKGDALNTVLHSKFKNFSLDEFDALEKSFIDSWTTNLSFSIYNTLISSGKIELISNDSLKYKVSKYKDLVNDYTEGEYLAKGNGRDFNWNYFVNQSALSTKTRFGIVPRNEFELNTDKSHYLKEYSSPQFQNALTILRLNMNEILKDGKNLKIESLALIELLDTEIKKFEN